MSEKRWSNFRPGVRLVYAAAGLLLAGVFVTSALAGADRQKRPRQLVRSETDTYIIMQADQEVGREKVVRSDYDDNSVLFDADIEMQMAHGANIKTVSNLLLEADSHFPLNYRMDRNVQQTNMSVEQKTAIEMFSNVAVITSEMQGKEQVLRKVLPTGTAVVDMMAAHHYYQPLYWYNRDSGGVQIFNVLDPLTRQQYSASMRLQQKETIEVGGKQVEAERYEYKRNQLTAQVWVDVNDRIVKVEQGFMVFLLDNYAE
jgi:hypothetical protein